MKTEKSDKQKAIMNIKRYLSVFRKGDSFYGLSLAGYVRERIGRPQMFESTVLRYMRELRESGEINYKVKNRRESEYIKL